MAVWVRWGANLKLNRECQQLLRKRAREAKRRGQEIFVTSGNDGKHQDDSFHYINDAWDDFEGTINVAGRSKRSLIKAQIKAIAGEDFDIIVKKSHTHTEYDPKRRR
jgi:predicted N-acyltransferase